MEWFLWFGLPAVSSALIQLGLCFKIRHKVLRHSTLILAAAAFCYAYLSLEERGMFSGLAALFYGAVGVCIIAGYGAAWGIYFIIKRKRKG